MGSVTLYSFLIYMLLSEDVTYAIDVFGTYIIVRVKCIGGPLTCEEVSVRSINFQSGFLGP